VVGPDTLYDLTAIVLPLQRSRLGRRQFTDEHLRRRIRAAELSLLGALPHADYLRLTFDRGGARDVRGGRRSIRTR